MVLERESGRRIKGPWEGEMCVFVREGRRGRSRSRSSSSGYVGIGIMQKSSGGGWDRARHTQDTQTKMGRDEMG